MNRSLTKKTGAVALVLSAGLVLSACTSESDSDSSAATTTTTAAADTSSQSAEPIATLDPIPTGGTTAVALDAAFVEALTTLGLTPGIVGNATLEGTTVTFPITGGALSVYDPEGDYRPFVQGTVLHQGSGLSLTAGGATVELTNFTVDPGTPARLFGDVSAGGQLVVPSAPLFIVDGSTLEGVAMEGSNAVLSGSEIELTQEAADLLNQTFMTDALAEGLLIGIATITVPTA